MQLTLDAPAKLNLFLGVLPRIINNRHQLISVFSATSLHDTLVFSLDDSRPAGCSLDIEYADGIAPLNITTDENIICRTVRAFTEFTGIQLDGHLHVRLRKRIPEQAGLGGGSSDAAATIQALAQLHGFEFTDERLLSLADMIGSDVPFFLSGDCALMDGSGEVRLQTLPQPALDLVLVKPTAGVSTAAAYHEFDRNPQPAGDVFSLVEALTAAEPVAATIAASLANNLYPAARALMPELESLIQELERQPGVLRALLTGSGSTVFGVCADAVAAQAAASALAAQGYWTHACTTARRG